MEESAGVSETRNCSKKPSEIRTFVLPPNLLVKLGIGSEYNKSNSTLPLEKSIQKQKHDAKLSIGSDYNKCNKTLPLERSIQRQKLADSCKDVKQLILDIDCKIDSKNKSQIEIEKISPKSKIPIIFDHKKKIHDPTQNTSNNASTNNEDDKETKYSKQEIQRISCASFLYSPVCEHTTNESLVETQTSPDLKKILSCEPDSVIMNLKNTVTQNLKLLNDSDLKKVSANDIDTGSFKIEPVKPLDQNSYITENQLIPENSAGNLFNESRNDIYVDKTDSVIDSRSIKRTAPLKKLILKAHRNNAVQEKNSKRMNIYSEGSISNISHAKLTPCDKNVENISELSEAVSTEGVLNKKSNRKSGISKTSNVTNKTRSIKVQSKFLGNICRSNNLQISSLDIPSIKVGTKKLKNNTSTEINSETSPIISNETNMQCEDIEIKNAESNISLNQKFNPSKSILSKPKKKRGRRPKSEQISKSSEELVSPRHETKHDMDYSDFELIKPNKKRKKSLDISECKITNKILKRCESTNSTNSMEAADKYSAKFYHMYVNLQMSVEDQTISSNFGMVTCTVCKESVQKSHWEIHKLKHNNLAFTTEEFVEFTDDIMTSILGEICGQTGVLICEKCCHSERVVPKFLKHINQCRKSSKNFCNFCSRMIVKSNQIPHMDLHYNLEYKKLSSHIKTTEVVENSSQIITEPVLSVTCAVCKYDILKNNWEEHKYKHNNLAWHEGEIAIDLNDDKQVKIILKRLHKSNKTLCCFDCGVTKNTVHDFMEHMHVCGKNLEQNMESKYFIKSNDPTDCKTVALENKTIKTPTKLTTREVLCARCNETIPRNAWNTHKKKHNNLAWNNEEEPLDMDDKKLLEKIFTSVIKSKKKLKCEICGTTKKSAVGFISHIERCNKTDEEINQLREPCTICGRLYFRTSLPVHMSQAHSAKSAIEITKQKLGEESIDCSNGRVQRKAATKAQMMIEDLKKGIIESEKKTINDFYTRPSKTRLPNPLIGCWKREIQNSEDFQAKCRNVMCPFKSSNIEEMKAHHVKCELSPKHGYGCTLCSFRCYVESEIQTHITEKHEEELKNLQNVKTLDSDNDEDYTVLNEESEYDSDAKADEWDAKILDVESKHSNLKRNRGVTKFSFILMETSVSSSSPICYPVAYRWTLRFRDKNYSTVALFQNWCDPVMSLISQSQSTYLGAQESVKIASLQGVMSENDDQTKNLNWKSFELFESKCDENGIVTMFCGGPVWGLAWCPFNNISDCPEEQYLAVSTHKKWEVSYEFDTSLNSKDTKGVIQIWRMGMLNNNEGKCTTAPKLEYMIAHKFGAIWRLEWCPSGGLFENYVGGENQLKCKRLGLLAAACSNGNIYIYSICIPLSTGTMSERPLYEQKPSAVLRFSHSTKNCMNHHVTALVWSKEKGHNILAAGFSDGYVAIWDINIKSTLLKHKDSDIDCLHPYHIFKPHLCSVTTLSIYPSLGSRYLFTGSLDRTYQFWQLNSGSGAVTAVPLNGSPFKGNRVTASAWNSHWITNLVALDDVCGFARTNSTFMSLRDLTFKPTIILNANSIIWDISCCDWSNAFIQVTESGELSAVYPHQIMVYVDSSKNIRHKRLMLGYSRIHKLNSNQTKSGNDDKVVNKQLLGQDLELIEMNTSSSPLFSENLSDNEEGTSNKTGEVIDKSSIIWENNYEELKKNHGILFCDLPSNLEKRVYNMNDLQGSSAPQYPLNSLMRVAYNPNYHSHSFIAVGMQAGFVRVRCLNGMRTQQNKC